jgi:hypothetical protein
MVVYSAENAQQCSVILTLRNSVLIIADGQATLGQVSKLERESLHQALRAGCPLTET